MGKKTKEKQEILKKVKDVIEKFSPKEDPSALTLTQLKKWERAATYLEEGYAIGGHVYKCIAYSRMDREKGTLFFWECPSCKQPFVAATFEFKHKYRQYGLLMLCRKCGKERAAAAASQRHRSKKENQRKPKKTKEELKKQRRDDIQGINTLPEEFRDVPALNWKKYEESQYKEKLEQIKKQYEERR